MTVTFTVPGEPKSKGRPRFAKVGNYVRTYTPETTANYENLVKLYYDMENGTTTLDGQLCANIECYFGIPKSATKKNRAAMLSGDMHCTKKPDCDNIAKIILDALNGIAYKDDSQVSTLTVTKRYAEQPRVVVRLEEI